ncbi:MAG: tyrosine-type recombinase/integrase [Gaiellaceae bacterium]
MGGWGESLRDGWHTRFRHTCATALFRRGWNAVQVQRWLGHHKPSFTLDTYAHLLEGDVPEPAFLDRITAPFREFAGPGPLSACSPRGLSALTGDGSATTPFGV